MKAAHRTSAFTVPLSCRWRRRPLPPPKKNARAAPPRPRAFPGRRAPFLGIVAGE